MKPLSLTLFGDVKLTVAPAAEISLPRKTQILLAYLATNQTRKFTRAKLASLIWTDRSEDQARQSFRQCLFTLTKSFGINPAPLVEADHHHVSLNSDVVAVDIWRFEHLLANDTPETLQQAVGAINPTMILNTV